MSPEPLTCEFFDGWSAVALAVRVELDATELRILDAAGALHRRWDCDGLQCDGMQDGGVLHVTHRSVSHESLAVRTPDLAARIVGASKHVQVLPGGERKLRFALLLLAVLVTFGGLLYHYVPVLTRALAVRVPLEQERALGAELEVLLSYSSCQDKAAETALAEISTQLSDDQQHPFQIRIMRADVPNAFALPGGVVVVTSKLLQSARTSDEVAGVLAHEIEHVVQRHVLAGFLRGAVLSAIWSLTVGDYSGLMAIDPSTAYRIKNLEFSRDDETAADSGAVARLQRAGISHQGLLEFFERMQAKEDGTPAWLSTHPSTQSRVARLRALGAAAAGKPALSEASFQAISHACR